MRRFVPVVATAVAMSVPSSAAAVEADASARTVHYDRNNDVQVVPFASSDPGRVGEANGDIRRIVTQTRGDRIRVAVTFDGDNAGFRLKMRLNFAARKVSGNLGHIVELAGDMATGRPKRSFMSFYPNSPGPERASCPGLRTSTDAGKWTFSVPRACLQQERRVRYQEVTLQTEYVYDDAYAYDHWPRRGTVKFR